MNPLRAQRAVFESDLATPSKIVLLALIDHYSHDRPMPFPGAARLAHWTGLNRRTVGRAIKDLERRGAVKVQRRRGVSNRYDLSGLVACLTGRTSDTVSLVAPGDQRHSVAGTGDTESLPLATQCPTKGPSKGTQKEPISIWEKKNTVSPPAPVGRGGGGQAWEPNDAHRAFARQHALDVELEVKAWEGHSSAARRGANLDASFTSWMATAVKLARTRRRGGPPQPNGGSWKAKVC